MQYAPTTLMLTNPFTVQQHFHCVVEGTGLNHFAGINEEDIVRVFDGIKAVGYDNAGGGFGQFVQNIAQKLFSDGIDISSSFIQDEQFRVAQYGAHKGDQLLLSQADAITV
jgi:hypothetical protein